MCKGTASNHVCTVLVVAVEDAWCDKCVATHVPTSAGSEAKLGEQPQWGQCVLVSGLEQQQGCQALPQLWLQLRSLGLPGKSLFCKGMGRALSPPGSLLTAGLPGGKATLLEQQTATQDTCLLHIGTFI